MTDGDDGDTAGPTRTHVRGSGPRPDGGDTARGWFDGIDVDDPVAGARRIRDGSAETPAEWAGRAVATGAVDDRETYYERLHAATLRAARDTVEEREGADDRQLVHAIRSLDDTLRVANELAERVEAWSRSRSAVDPMPTNDRSGGRVESEHSATADGDTAIDAMACARAVAGSESTDPVGARLVDLADRVVALDEEATRLRAHVRRTAPDVAPNLAALAGPVLAARLIALAGGLESLARMPSGTVQVLGAEQALFAHLRGEAPSPKHGVIYVHDYVRNTAPDRRGAAARALAGKLAIAARADHYTGTRRPELDRQLQTRIERLRTDDAVADGAVDPTDEGGDGR